MRGAVVEHVEKKWRDLMVKLKGGVVFGSHLGLESNPACILLVKA